MKTFFEMIKSKIAADETLFYNTSGNNDAYKLGVKHLGSSTFLGYGELIGGTLYVKIDFLLVDFEHETITQIFKGDKLTVTPLQEA